MKRVGIIVALLLSASMAFAAGESIEVWMISNPVPEIIKAFDTAAANFEAATGVKVNYVRVPTNDFHTKLITSLSAKQYPDVVIWNIHPGLEFQATGAVVPVDDVVSSLGKDLFSDTLLKSCSSGGKLYEIPFLARPSGLHVRKDWLKKAGYDTTLYKDAKGIYYVKGLRTWEDVLEAGKKMTDKAAGKYGLGFQFSRKGFGDSAAFALNVLFSYGGSLLDAQGNVAINAKAAIDAFTFIKKMWDSGAVPAAATTWDGNSNNQYFIKGDIGIVSNSNSIMAKLTADTGAKPEDLLIVPYPSGPNGVSRMWNNPETITIFKTSRLDASKKFARYLIDAKTQVQMFKIMNFGYYSPLRTDVMDDPLFDSLSDNERVMMQDSTKITDASYPAEPNGKINALINAYVMDDALSRIAVDGWTPQQVVKELEQKIKSALED